MILFFHNTIILYYLFYYLSWANKLEEFTDIVNPNYQLLHSRNLLVHLHIPKNHQLLNEQQHLYLLLQKTIKTVLFCIPKIPPRMIQPSQKMTTYSLVRQQNKIKLQISFQPFQHLITINNLLLPHPQVY